MTENGNWPEKFEVEFSCNGLAEMRGDLAARERETSDTLSEIVDSER